MTEPFQFKASDVTIEKRETVFEGFFRMDKLWLTHPRFDGRSMPQFTRELFIRGDATCVLPYDPSRDEIVLLGPREAHGGEVVKARKKPGLASANSKKSVSTLSLPVAPPK